MMVTVRLVSAFLVYFKFELILPKSLDLQLEYFEGSASVLSFRPSYFKKTLSRLDSMMQKKVIWGKLAKYLRLA